MCDQFPIQVYVCVYESIQHKNNKGEENSLFINVNRNLDEENTRWLKIGEQVCVWWDTLKERKARKECNNTKTKRVEVGF